MCDSNYICVQNCPELDYYKNKHCEKSEYIEDYVEEYGCCPVGNVPVWKEKNGGEVNGCNNK